MTSELFKARYAAYSIGTTLEDQHILFASFKSLNDNVKVD